MAKPMWKRAWKWTRGNILYDLVKWLWGHKGWAWPMLVTFGGWLLIPFRQVALLWSQSSSIGRILLILGLTVLLCGTVLLVALVRQTITPTSTTVEVGRGSAGDLRLELEVGRNISSRGITIFLINNADSVLRGCGVSLGPVSRYYEQLGDFIPPRMHKSFNLIQPTDLEPRHRSAEAYLAHVKDTHQGFFTIGNPEAGQLSQDTVSEPGVWRASLVVFSAAPHRAYGLDVCLQWERGSKPRFALAPTNQSGESGNAVDEGDEEYGGPK